MRYFFAYFKLILIFVCLLTSKVNASILDVDNSFNRVVQIAVTEIPYSLSPYANDALQAQYAHLFFDPLVRWGQDKTLEYRLLAKLKPLKGNKVRFYLKKNIHFHSGNLLTSKDIIWSYNQASRQGYKQSNFKHSIKIKRINNYQFDIQSELTQAQLLDYLTHLYILDSAYYKKNKIEHDVAQSALPPPIKTLPLSGTGPYRVDSFYPGVNLRVQASRSYWQNQAMIKALNFVKVKSIDSRLYALLADDIDISEAIASKNINSVKLLANKTTYQTASLNALFLVINAKQNSIFERETARNAIHLAINQKGMLRHILFGNGSIDSTIKITPEGVKQPIYDAKRAKYLLQKIESPKQLTLLVLQDEAAQTEEVIIGLENMLKKVGVKLDVTVVNAIEDWNKLQFDYDLTLSAWRSPLMHGDNLYNDIFTNSHISNYIQSLFKQQDKALTMDEKIALFKQYQESDRIIPLFSKNTIWATDTQFDMKNVFSINAIPYWHLLTISH